MEKFQEFCGDESGATAIEYGLIAAIVGVGIISALINYRTALVDSYQHVADSLNNAY